MRRLLDSHNQDGLLQLQQQIGNQAVQPMLSNVQRNTSAVEYQGLSQTQVKTAINKTFGKKKANLGQIKFLDTQSFVAAFEAIYGAGSYRTMARGAGGFAYGNMIYIDLTYYDYTTLLHEAIHTSGASNTVALFDVPLNEGITEYLTRRAFTKLKQLNPSLPSNLDYRNLLVILMNLQLRKYLPRKLGKMWSKKLILMEPMYWKKHSTKRLATLLLLLS
jgi:hypothetical protein